MPRPSSPQTASLRSALAASMCAAAAALAGCSGGSPHAASSTPSSPGGFEGALLPAGLHPREFQLADQSGRRVGPGDFRGRVVILAFLDTGSRASALIAQQIRGALDELPPRGPGAPAALAVSVAPRIDTRARVQAFLRANDLRGRLDYLTGTPSQLRAAWRAYRVVPASAGELAYERAAFVVLLSPSGAERAELPLEELAPEALARDVQALTGS